MFEACEMEAPTAITVDSVLVVAHFTKYNPSTHVLQPLLLHPEGMHI